MTLSQQQETLSRGRDTAVKKQHCERKKLHATGSR